MKFLIFSKPDCPWCTRAKDLLTVHDSSYIEFNIDEDETARTFLKESNLKSVPQIYHNGRLVGGYLALESYFGLN
jgi:glutaredoxin